MNPTEKPIKPMSILITGASGLIGKACTAYLTQQGYQVVALQRQDDSQPFYWHQQDNQWTVQWDNTHPIDAVIHLAGESLGSKRWSNKKRQAIYDSRIGSTQALVKLFARLPKPPSVFLCASAIGYYGNCGEIFIDETQPAGDDFLASLAKDWEAAAQPAETFGIRVVHLRTGLVLSPDGGALASMLPAFKAGMGGRLGNGQQRVSWVSINEIPKMIAFLLNHPQARGPVNVVNQQSTDNATLTKTLGQVLKRPTCLSMPAVAIKTLFGEMGELLLLSSADVKPKKLKQLGYHFDDDDLETVLTTLLKGDITKD